MKTKFLPLVTTLLMLVTGLNPSHAFTDQEYLSTLLTTSYHPEAIKLGAREIHTNNSQNQQILDIVAEQLLATYKNESVDADARSWLAKTLGASGSLRYEGVLQHVLENTKNKKLKKYTANALKQLSAPGDAYLLEQKTQNTIQKQLKVKRKNNPSRERQNKAFSELQQNDTIEDVFKSMGYPDGAGSNLFVRDLPKFGKRRMQQLLLKYSDVGIVILTKGGTSGTWSVYETMPYPQLGITLPTTPIDYNNLTIPHLLDQLWSWDVYQLLEIKRALKGKFLKEEELDLIAYRVWLGTDTIDPFIADALAHLTYFIKASRNPRYATLMEDAWRKTKDKKLRKHIKKAAKITTKSRNKDSVEQYIPFPEELLTSEDEKRKFLSDYVKDLKNL